MPLLALCAALAAAPAQEFLTLQHAPVSAMLRHPKDAGLARLLELAPAVIERIMQQQGADAPPGFVELAAGLLTAEKHLTVGVAESSEVPFYASLVVTAATEAEAQRRSELLDELMAMAGVERGERLANGLASIETPMPAPVALGTVGRDFALTIGTDRLARPAAVEVGLPKGVTPWLQMTQSMAALQALMERAGEGAEAGLLASVLQPGDQRVAMGADANWMWSASAMVGTGAMLRDSGAIPAGGLPLTALARVPEDATFAMVGRLDWSGLWALLEAQVARIVAITGESEPDLRAELTRELGFDLVGEVLPHFGPTTGMYLSDTTGGGTLASAVLFSEVKDRAAVQSLAERLTAMIAEEAGGAVEVRQHRVGQLELSSLVFPGLPVPVTPTWVIDGGYLYLGLSPQAAAAAVESARAGGGLTQNPRFRAGIEAVGHDASVVSVTFLDSPELLGDGYAYTSMLLELAGNLVRTAGAGPDPGLLAPTYGALARGARASVGVTRLVGDDIVSISCGDPSWTVNLTAVMGLLDRSGAMMVLPMALMGVGSSTAFGDTEWTETGIAEWHEPLFEGGSLVALYDWMATGAEDTHDAVLAQVELHFEAETGTVTLFGVDADVTTLVRTAQPELTITAFDENDEPLELTLRHVANDETGESVGDSATYRGADERVKGWSYLRGSIRSIEIAGRTFQDVWFWCDAQ